MNDEQLTQLKTIVERVVRPVRASGHRKRRMREELLDHARFAFEEEMHEDAQVDTAINRVRQRLGDPGQLSVQLQNSTRVAERIAWRLEQVLRFRPGESPLRRAVRHAMLVFLAYAAQMLLFLAPLGLIGGTERSQSLPFLFSLILLVSVMLSVFTLLAHGLRQALFLGRRRSPLRAGILLMLASLTVVAAFGAIGLALLPERWYGFDDVILIRNVLILAFIAPLGLLLFAWQTSREIRYAQEWQSLQIDE